jgi:hypothetical protein
VWQTESEKLEALGLPRATPVLYGGKCDLQVALGFEERETNRPQFSSALTFSELFDVHLQRDLPLRSATTFCRSKGAAFFSKYFSKQEYGETPYLWRTARRLASQIVLHSATLKVHRRRTSRVKMAFPHVTSIPVHSILQVFFECLVLAGR